MSDGCVTGCCQKHPIKTKPVRCLKRLHSCCILCGKILASAILLSLTLWLFLRPRPPLAYVKSFEFETPEDTNRTLVRYCISIHNPDMYKSIVYDTLALRIFYVGGGYSGVTVDFDGGFVQEPRRSTTLRNDSANIGYNLNQYWGDITAGHYPFRLTLAMIVRYKPLNRLYRKSQITRVAIVYFNETGNAFIDPRRGLPFRY